MAVLGILRRVLATVPSNPTTLAVASSHEVDALARRVLALETHVKALYDHIKLLESDEVKRAAEHATMVDQLSRLYKRVSARIARADVTAPEGESVLNLRQRLGR